MKTNNIHTEINTEFFSQFIKLTPGSQENVLKSKGMVLDSDVEKEKRTILFYLQGFFVEEIRSVFDNSLIEIIPYKHGFKLQNYSEMNGGFIPKTGHSKFVTIG